MDGFDPTQNLLSALLGRVSPPGGGGFSSPGAGLPDFSGFEAPPQPVPQPMPEVASPQIPPQLMAAMQQLAVQQLQQAPPAPQFPQQQPIGEYRPSMAIARLKGQAPQPVQQPQLPPTQAPATIAGMPEPQLTGDPEIDQAIGIAYGAVLKRRMQQQGQ